jgi:flavin-dependent dehydrogenase
VPLATAVSAGLEETTMIAPSAIVPTVDVETAASQKWDALVIGSGPAGALAARQAALSGKRVLLVDSKSFPRSKVCGACLNGQALAVLQAVGLEALPARLGGMPLNQFDVRGNGRGVRLALPEGMAVSRLRFDAALVEAAIAAGAAFLPETAAAVGAISRGGREESRAVALRFRDSPAREAFAGVVLAADGLAHASLRDCTEFTSRVARNARIGLGAIIVDYPPTYAPGTIFMAVGRLGYVGLVRVEDGLLNVAAALAPDFIKEHGSPSGALASVIEAAGFPAIPALAEADCQGTLPLTRRTTPTAARRLLVLGDAAGYVEPFTGEGMAWALSAAAAATPFIERGLFEWDADVERDWQKVLHRAVFGRQRWCRFFAVALRHPLAMRIVLRTVSMVPSLSRPIIRSLNRPPAMTCTGIH